MSSAREQSKKRPTIRITSEGVRYVDVAELVSSKEFKDSVRHAEEFFKSRDVRRDQRLRAAGEA